MTRESLGNEPDAVRARLRALPKALGYPTQAAFAVALGIEPSRYSNAILTGSIGKDLATIIYTKVRGMRVEWLFFGDHYAMRPDLMRKIDAVLTEESDDDSRVG